TSLRFSTLFTLHSHTTTEIYTLSLHDALPISLLTRKLITGERVMLSELVLKKGCVVPAHHHENEQVSYVIRGKLKFEVNGKEIRSEEHTSELQSRVDLVCRLLLEKKKKKKHTR